MKSKEQIINDSIKLETPPEDYNLLEVYCFLALKQLLIMFYNKQISQLNATIMKNKILAKYEGDSKQYEFERSMFQEHIENIKNTENLRIKLRKQLNANTELNEVINTCLELIQLYSGEEFI